MYNIVYLMSFIVLLSNGLLESGASCWSLLISTFTDDSLTIIDRIILHKAHLVLGRVYLPFGRSISSHYFLKALEFFFPLQILMDLEEQSLLHVIEETCKGIYATNIQPLAAEYHKQKIMESPDSQLTENSTHMDFCKLVYAAMIEVAGVLANLNYSWKSLYLYIFSYVVASNGSLLDECIVALEQASKVLNQLLRLWRSKQLKFS